MQEAGIFVRDHFVERLIKSKYAQPYHPIRSYITKVRGTWDGKDRICDFLRRINPSDYCLKMGRIWLRAMVAQMAGYDGKPDWKLPVYLLLSASSPATLQQNSL